MHRDLDWDGCLNVRDLGGLPLTDGRTTRWGAVVRADNPSRLSPAGWQAMSSHGVRTVITLRTVGATDPEPDPAVVPSGMVVERVSLEDLTDPEFRRRCVDTQLWATPLEWVEMLRFWPDRCASAVRAVAQSRPGGVVVSCGIGRDRTGLVAFLLLALVGTPSGVIAEDWSRSLDRLVDDPAAASLSPIEIMARYGSSVTVAVDAALAMDVQARLIAAGLHPADLEAVRNRLTA